MLFLAKLFYKRGYKGCICNNLKTTFLKRYNCKTLISLMRILVHYLMRDVGTGSRPHALLVLDFMSLQIFTSKNGLEKRKICAMDESQGRVT